MGNILEKFWYRHIKPQEQSKESSREIKDLLKLMGRNRDRLHDSMTGEQRETLKKIRWLHQRNVQLDRTGNVRLRIPARR